MTPCPACSNPGTRVLMGIFPVWICEEADCNCVWGFWSLPACWIAQYLYPPTNHGFAFPVVKGGYWWTLWRMVRGEL